MENLRATAPVMKADARLLGLIALAALLLAGLSTPVKAADDAADLERGAALYENHCSECHDRHVHKRDSTLVDSIDVLRAWVHAWSAHQRLDWNAEDIDDVSAWLATTVYRFDQ